MDARDDGRIRTGSMLSGTAHAFTAIVGSGILALPWSVAQLGWILGLIILVAFAAITYYTAILLSDCYRTPDPINGSRNYTYMDAVRALLGPKNVVVCGIMQYSLLWGTMIGYTITTAISVANLKRSTCYHKKGENAKCHVSGNFYMFTYGAIEIILSQCPNLEKATFLSIIAAVTSLVYSSIALCLSIAKIFSHRKIKGNLMVMKAGVDVASSKKIWHAFQALGNIAFAYTYSMMLLEIQDTLKSPPPENKMMKKVSLYAIGATALFYISLGCMGYAAYGTEAPGNILTGFYNVLWLVDIANIAVIIHLIGAYQVFAQPIFAMHEKWLESRWPTSSFNNIYTIRFPLIIKNFTVRFTLARLLLRTAFVIFTTGVAMMFPFFNAILGLLGSISFWPLTVHLPLRMYIEQAKIKRGSLKWFMLQILGLICLVVTLVSAIGSIADISDLLKHAKLLHIQL
ncbi:hypothetical protein WN943_015290 [Citrus x changshan-huyou]